MNRGRVTDIRSTVSRESRARPPVSRLNTGRRLEKRPRGLWTGSLPLSLVSRTGPDRLLAIACHGDTGRVNPQIDEQSILFRLDS